MTILFKGISQLGLDILVQGEEVNYRIYDNLVNSEIWKFNNLNFNFEGLLGVEVFSFNMEKNECINITKSCNILVLDKNVAIQLPFSAIGFIKVNFRENLQQEKPLQMEAVEALYQ